MVHNLEKLSEAGLLIVVTLLGCATVNYALDVLVKFMRVI